ncbi:three-helix bundle dimerization domain-containing protein [Nonomuraea rubra]
MHFSDAYRRFDGFPIRDFVPVLAERLARSELTPHRRPPPPTAAPAETASSAQVGVQAEAPPAEAAAASVTRRKVLLPVPVADRAVQAHAGAVHPLGRPRRAPAQRRPAAAAARRRARLPLG